MDTRVIQHYTKPWFLIALASYLFVRLSREFSFHLPDVVNGYLGDLLCLPLLLWVIVGILRYIHRPYSVMLGPLQIGLAWLSVCVIFEGVLPMRSEVYTADLIDVVLYSIGGVAFWWIQSNENSLSKKLLPDNLD